METSGAGSLGHGADSWSGAEMSVRDEERLDKQGIVRNTSHAPVSPGPLALTLDLTATLTDQSFFRRNGNIS